MYIASQIKYSFWVEFRISSEFSILVQGEISGVATFWLHAKTVWFAICQWLKYPPNSCE